MIADAYADGRVDLAHARGRSCFPIDVQAAELFLRTARAIDGVDDVGLRRVSRAGAYVRAELRSPFGPFEVRLERSWSRPRALTCHAQRRIAVPTYRLVSIERAG